MINFYQTSAPEDTVESQEPLTVSEDVDVSSNEEYGQSRIPLPVPTTSQKVVDKTVDEIVGHQIEQWSS